MRGCSGVAVNEIVGGWLEFRGEGEDLNDIVQLDLPPKKRFNVILVGRVRSIPPRAILAELF